MEVWSHRDTRYEVESFYSLPADAWTYELVEMGAAESGATLRVMVPDATPEGPFTPTADGDVTVHLDATGMVPWPIFRRFLQLIEASGDILDSQPTALDDEG